MRRTLLSFVFVTISFFLKASLANQSCQALFASSGPWGSPRTISLSHLSKDYYQFLLAARDAGLISKKQGELLSAAMNDLSLTTVNRMNEANAQIFLDNWNQLHRTLTLHLRQLKNIPKKERWLWERKLQAPIHFATAHLAAFMNHNKPDFDYGRLLNILEAANQAIGQQDLAFFIYSFEKEVRKFSSEKEFKNCR